MSNIFCTLGRWVLDASSWCFTHEQPGQESALEYLHYKPVLCWEGWTTDTEETSALPEMFLLGFIYALR